MKATRWLALSCFVAFFAAGQALAAVITGTVANQSTERFLERALVRVQGTSFQTLTESDGRFRISGLPAGTYTVVADYAGLNQADQRVTVSADGTARIDFALTSDVYELDPYVVQSTVEGTAFAINQQRRAETQRSVTSVDAFLDNVTGNPGEFLRNVPGIQMDFNQVEPSHIRIRGFDPTLTTVTMDGNEIASADSASTNRRVAIDQLSLGSIDNVEVFKAPIPSMSANAIGGAVNFNSRMAYDQQGRRISLTLGATGTSHHFHLKKVPSPGHGDRDRVRWLPVGRFSYSNSFFDNRLGVSFTVGRSDTIRQGQGSTNTVVFAPLVDGAARPAPPELFTRENTRPLRTNFSLSPNAQRRLNDSVSLNLDFKLTDEISVFLRTSFADYFSTNRNHNFNLSSGARADAAASRRAMLEPGFTPEQYTTTAGTMVQSVNVFNKMSKSWQLAPGLLYRSGPWRIDLNGGFSKATNHYRNPDTFSSVEFRIPGTVGYSMAVPMGSEMPSSIVQHSGPDIYDLNNYVIVQGSPTNASQSSQGGFVSKNDRDSFEVKYSGRLDVQRNFAGQFPSYVKTGLSYNLTMRDRSQPRTRWYYVGPAPLNLGQFAEPGPISAGFGVREPTYLSSKLMHDYFLANPSHFLFNEAYAAQQQFSRRKVNETILGAYALYNISVNKLNVLAGLRLEDTDIEAYGNRTLPTSGPNNVLPAGVHANSLEGVLLKNQPVRTLSGYTSDPFPYLHLRYEWLPNLQVRASYTEAIGRPNFTQVLPNMSQNDTAAQPTVTVQNVGLEPQRSKNLDFSIEYYTKTAGEWTAAWFQRDIKDFITSSRTPITGPIPELNLGGEFVGYDLISSENAGNAVWRGYELGFRQRLSDLDFLPKALHGIELFGNHTRIYHMDGDFGIDGATITHLSRVSKSLFNAGISYRSPRGTFYTSLITNYQSTQPQVDLPPRSAGGNQEANTARPYQFWNLEASYRITPRLRLTVTGQNLLAERKTFVVGGDIQRNRQQDAGTVWMFSARMDL